MLFSLLLSEVSSKSCCQGTTCERYLLTNYCLSLVTETTLLRGKAEHTEKAAGVCLEFPINVFAIKVLELQESDYVNFISYFIFRNGMVVYVQKIQLNTSFIKPS